MQARPALREIGHQLVFHFRDHFRRRRRRRRADVGAVVGNRDVDLVADRAHRRHRAGAQRAGDGLLVECPEVLEASAAAGDHQAFVRFRTGLVAPEPDSPEAAKPPKRDRAFELSLLTEIAQPFLQKKEAVAFFAPAGEALRSREQIDAALQRKVGAGQVPFDLWTNVRAVTLSRTPEATWQCLDIVGMAQFGLPDVEAIFADGREDPDGVEQLLRNACFHLLSGRAIAPGSTSDDAKGRRWEASHAFALVGPRRPVVRWLPYGRSRASQGLIAKLAAETAPG